MASLSTCHLELVVWDGNLEWFSKQQVTHPTMDIRGLVIALTSYEKGAFRGLADGGGF